MKSVDSRYANPSVTAHKNNVVCNGNVLPKAVKDIDALQGDGQRKIRNGLTLDIVAIDDDVFIGDAKLVLPVPTLNSVVMNAF